MDQPISVRTNLVSGQGSLRDAAEIVDGRVFLITDPGIVAAGHVARLEDIFAARMRSPRRHLSFHFTSVSYVPLLGLFILAYFGVFLAYFWRILAYFWCILAYFGVFWRILAYFGVFWRILAYFGVFLRILAYFGVFWRIFGVFYRISA